MDDLIEVVGLAESANAKVITLSGGLRRRLDVAIGIVGRPEVVFLDEPTAGFDPHARRDFHDLVHRLSDFENTTVLMTTHDLDEAEKVADRILVLDEGRIVADGSAEQLARELTTTAEVRWTSAGRRHVHGSVGRCREASRATRRDRSENLGDAGMTTATALDARWAAARAGFPRGWIETRQVYTETTSLIWSPVFPLMYVGVLLLIRGKTVPGTDFALGAMVLPSLLGVSIAFGGVVGSASTIAIDREDGTLLRAKATPNGMLGYLVGKIVMSP